VQAWIPLTIPAPAPTTALSVHNNEWNLNFDGLKRGDTFSIEVDLPHINPCGKNNGKYAPPLPCLYTNDPSAVARWIQEFVYEDDRCFFVGFDTERVPEDAPWVKERGWETDAPATVQISTAESSLVVHLWYCDDDDDDDDGVFPDALRHLLYDDGIVKVGLGINKDLSNLYSYHLGIENASRCIFELGGIQSVGLKCITKRVTGVELSKTTDSRDWTKYLSKKQLSYCARDAWAGAVVFNSLVSDTTLNVGKKKRNALREKRRDAKILCRGLRRSKSIAD